MSIANYTDLKTAIANWLDRDDLTASITDFITLGEKRIYRELRIRALETNLNSTIASGVIAVPSDYLELKYAYVDISPVQHLARKTAEWMYDKYPTRSADGIPNFIAREGSNFIFGPYPDSAYSIKGIYYKKLDALSDSNTTNWFTTNAPDLLLFSALLEAEPFLKNEERIKLWETKYEMVKQQIKHEDKQEYYSGSVLSITAS